MRLLNQFGIQDAQVRHRYLVLGLLSEIGSPPLSYSTRWIFQIYNGLRKADYAKALFDTFLRSYDLLGKEEYEVVWSTVPGMKKEMWFTEAPAMANFPELTPLKLARDIDYVLRDGYYTGRYSKTFDVRHFLSLRKNDTAEMNESIQELYRAIYALNAVYGDKTRRFLNRILARLSAILIREGHLDAKSYADPNVFIYLDDDEFLADMRRAVDRSGSDLLVRMYSMITQLEPMHIEQIPFSYAWRELGLEDVEELIAEERFKQKEAVFCINDTYSNEIGYVLFGRHFGSFMEGVRSEFFSRYTGLGAASDSNRTGMMDEGHLFVVAI